MKELEERWWKKNAQTESFVLLLLLLLLFIVCVWTLIENQWTLISWCTTSLIVFSLWNWFSIYVSLLSFNAPHLKMDHWNWNFECLLLRRHHHFSWNISKTDQTQANYSKSIDTNKIHNIFFVFNPKTRMETYDKQNLNWTNKRRRNNKKKN